MHPDDFEFFTAFCKYSLTSDEPMTHKEWRQAAERKLRSAFSGSIIPAVQFAADRLVHMHTRVISIRVGKTGLKASAEVEKFIGVLRVRDEEFLDRVPQWRLERILFNDCNSRRLREVINFMGRVRKGINYELQHVRVPELNVKLPEPLLPEWLAQGHNPLGKRL